MFNTSTWLPIWLSSPYTSLAPLKFLLWQQHHFCLFQLMPCVFEFPMVPGVYILECPQEEEVHSSFWGYIYTHSAAQSSKRFKSLSDTILGIMARSLLNWKKTQTRKLTVFMLLVIWPSSTLKFVFVFYFN